MGYTTTFEGAFNIDRALTKVEAWYMYGFLDKRHVSMDVVQLRHAIDAGVQPKGMAPFEDELGFQGTYYVGDVKNPSRRTLDTHRALDRQFNYIIDYNMPPAGVPGLWCDWALNAEGNAVVWSGAEKFYNAVAWIKFLIIHFFQPWGYKLNGTMKWQGEDADDAGTIIIVDNVVTTKREHFNAVGFLNSL